ncbi:hypothetical protein NQ317_011051 [Molorchus minor]|uniref:Uncharacterized protein n=1 Tax=Molorchus minor TaxID=1323400 RepID=A0ABQ9J8K8_9CUCU|nr:hypothetical protein NQ317_011051 [Molorchus minor]
MIDPEYIFVLPLVVIFKKISPFVNFGAKYFQIVIGLSKGSFQEAALIIFPSTPIKNTEDGMKRWLRRANKRVNRTYESKEHYC